MAIVCVLAVSGPARAQTAGAAGVDVPSTFTLAQAIAYATDHYPAIRAALEQVNASTAGVDVAQAAYLPRLDSLWQSNRATANNVFGQVLPQSIIPSLSGPVLPSASSQSVWGSATGVLFSWEPFDFGLRQSNVLSAKAALTRARAGEALTQLDVQTAVGEAFLAVVGAERNVAVAQADRDRRDVLTRVVHTLVNNQLRPGADASRVDAEQAAAETRMIQARAAVAVARTTLARLLGLKTSALTVDTASLLDQLPVRDPNTPAMASHPLAQVHQASVDQAKAQQDALARTDLPRLYVLSSAFARGSGAHADGQLDGGIDGLGLDRANWAAGVQVVFPNIFDFSSLRARKSAAAASERVEAALYDEALLTIRSQQEIAATMLDAARGVAANTPVQLAAAQQAESQARARYQAGLASILEVADAQSLLAQADVLDQVARVDVWRAMLAAAAADGDLTPFVSLLHPSSGGR